jgi:hypothetical protein
VGFGRIHLLGERPGMIDDILDEEGAREREAAPIKSKYEFVMAASKEAERLNESNRRRGLNSAQDAKVTVEAVRRIQKRLSRIVYEEGPDPSTDSNKETPYILG